MTPDFAQLRRRLALAGGRPASSSAEAVHGRREEAEFRPATLVERPLRHIPVGDPLPWTEDIAFLDGTQHAELIGYAATLPILAAVVRAGVRRRHDRRMSLAVDRCRRVVIGRREALEYFDALPAGFDPVTIDDEDEPHPIRDMQTARGLVDRARAGLEIEVARAFREGESRRAWLIVDGSLAASPDWGRDPRMIGVVKSQPFQMNQKLETSGNGQERASR